MANEIAWVNATAPVGSLTLVQSQAAASWSGVSGALQYAANCTPGSLLVAIFTLDNSQTITVSQMADDLNGGTWGTAAISQLGISHGSTWIFTKANTSSGKPTVTGTLSSGSDNGYIQLYEITGQNASPIADAQAQQPNAQFLSLTLAATANNIIIAGAAVYPATLTNDTGYTLDLNFPNPGWLGHGFEHIADAGSPGNKTISFADAAGGEGGSFCAVAIKA